MSRSLIGQQIYTTAWHGLSNGDVTAITCTVDHIRKMLQPKNPRSQRVWQDYFGGECDSFREWHLPGTKCHKTSQYSPSVPEKILYHLFCVAFFTGRGVTLVLIMMPWKTPSNVRVFLIIFEFADLIHCTFHTFDVLNWILRHQLSCVIHTYHTDLNSWYCRGCPNHYTTTLVVLLT